MRAQAESTGTLYKFTRTGTFEEGNSPNDEASKTNQATSRASYLSNATPDQITIQTIGVTPQRTLHKVTRSFIEHSQQPPVFKIGRGSSESQRVSTTYYESSVDGNAAATKRGAVQVGTTAQPFIYSDNAYYGLRLHGGMSMVLPDRPQCAQGPILVETPVPISYSDLFSEKLQKGTLRLTLDKVVAEVELLPDGGQRIHLNGVTTDVSAAQVKSISTDCGFWLEPDFLVCDDACTL